MSDFLLPVFKSVSVIFAISAVVTGAQAVLYPAGFARTFGLPLTTVGRAGPAETYTFAAVATDVVTTSAGTSSHPRPHDPAASYVALVGARQGATGLVLLLFARRGKWVEMATMLVVLGVLVAGLDGVHLARAGNVGRGYFHAVPGLVIAALAAAVVVMNE